MSRLRATCHIFSPLLLILYLLAGIGTAHGLIWCEESAALVHLEFNLSGECSEGCSALTGPERPATAGEHVLLHAGDGCNDTPVNLHHAFGSQPRQPSFSPLLALQSLPTLAAMRPIVVARLPRLNLTDQPPPRQSLGALRTIVLLN